MIDKKCPKCGSRNFQLVAHYVVGYIYEVENGRVIADGQDEAGEYVKTVCYCRNCNHQWHPRKIDYVIDE